MNRLSHLCTLAFALAALLLGSCDEPYAYERHSYPFQILAIGNSYTENATVYLPDLLREKHDTNVRICRLIKRSSSLADHWQNHLTNAPVYRLDVGSWQGWRTIDSIVTLDQALAFAPWNIVVLQQVSWYSGLPASYQPCCDSLLSLVSRNAVRRRIAFHKTWAYSRYSASNDFAPYNYNQQNMDSAIASATAAIAPKFDIIIPSGDLIRALRSTSLNNCMDLTEDGSHLDLGLPALALSMLWYNDLISPFTRSRLFPTSVRPYQGKIDANSKDMRIIQEQINGLYTP